MNFDGYQYFHLFHRCLYTCIVVRASIALASLSELLSFSSLSLHLHPCQHLNRCQPLELTFIAISTFTIFNAVTICIAVNTDVDLSTLKAINKSHRADRIGYIDF